MRKMIIVCASCSIAIAAAGEILSYTISGDSFRVWSIGPDGIDQGGAIEFDIANGPQSTGDLLYLSGVQYPYAKDGSSLKFEMTRRNLQNVGKAIEAYYIDHQAYPIPPLGNTWLTPLHQPLSLTTPIAYLIRPDRNPVNGGPKVYHPAVRL